MDVYVVDTNIVFSSAMNPNSTIGRFIMASNPKNITFYAPEYLQDEIDRHFDRLVEKSKLTEKEVKEQLDLVYSKIHFVPDKDIPMENYLEALPFVKDIDMDDLVFVALNNYKKGILWTGDTSLYRHLIQKGYSKVMNFDELKEKYQI